MTNPDNGARVALRTCGLVRVLRGVVQSGIECLRVGPDGMVAVAWRGR